MFNNISLFTGAMGLDLGLEQAGFRTTVAVEMDPWCANTIRSNRPSIKVIQRDIRQVSTREILEAAGLKRGEPDLISGGPPCQPFSTAGKRGSIRDIRGQLFLEFLRVVRESQPKYFIIENVKGILSAAINHRPLDKRGKKHAPLRPYERPGAALKYLLSEFDKSGYKVTYRLVNAADYGVPQVRERVFFIGSRDGVEVPFPEPTHSKRGSGGKENWRTLSDAICNLNDNSPLAMKIPPARVRYLKKIPAGGNWRDLPLKLQKKAMGAAYYSGGGKTGFLRRLSFSEPAPTLVTCPVAKATSLLHPTELRPLSVKEYARIQQFPDDWKLDGAIRRQYRQIGNAVPIGLGRAFGEVIRECLSRNRIILAQELSCRSRFQQISKK